MKLHLYGGPADGANVIVPVDKGEMQTFPYIDADGATVLYFRQPHHCGHAEHPVIFLHPSLQDKIG